MTLLNNKVLLKTMTLRINLVLHKIMTLQDKLFLQIQTRQTNLVLQNIMLVEHGTI